MGSKLLVLGVALSAMLAWSIPASAQDMVEVTDPGDAPEDYGAGPSVEIGVDYYHPEFYQNYPVFYDDTGRPYYYIGGSVRYVPSTYVNYHNLRRHYRLHRHNYRRWYRARGHRHHGYRRVVRVGAGGVAVDFNPLYHDGYTVFYDDSGVPYYYEGDRMVYIPRHHPRYRVYRRHYTRYRPRYRTWYRHHGRTYHRRRGGPAVRVRGSHGRSVRVGTRGGVHVRGPAGSVHVRTGAPHGRPAVRGGGAVDCRRNPGHPACRRGGRRYAPAPAATPRGRREQRRDRRRDRRHR